MEYTRQDYDKNHKELMKKRLLFGLLWVVYLGGLIVLLILRMQLWCSLLCLFGGMPLIFFMYVYLLPPSRYHKLLLDMAEGRSRISRVNFRCVEPGQDMRDGLPFRAFIVVDDEGYEHRFYWDVEKPLPDFAPGQRLELETFGQTLKRVQVIA